MNRKTSQSTRVNRIGLAVCSLLLTGIAAGNTAYAAGEGDIRRFEGQTLAIAGYSSTFNEIWSNSFGQYFEERTGVKLEWIPSSPSKNITRIRAAGGNPDIDVMLMDSANLARGVQEDVVGTLDLANIPNMSKVPESLRIDSGIPSMMYRYGNCYRTDKFAEKGLAVPNGADVWFTDELDGHVMFPSTTAAQWLITAPAIAKSVGGDYADPDKTFDALSSGVKAYGFFNSSGDMDAAMTAGDVWLTVGNVQGRCLALKRQGVAVEYANWQIEDGGKQYTDLANPDNLVMVKGTPKKELVEFFMNEYLSEEAATASLPLYQFIAGTPPTAAAVGKLLETDPATEVWIIKDPAQLFLPEYGDFLPHLRGWTTGWGKILQ